MKWRLLLAGLALSSASQLHAQDGSWRPAGARRALHASLWADG